MPNGNGAQVKQAEETKTTTCLNDIPQDVWNNILDRVQPLNVSSLSKTGTQGRDICKDKIKEYIKFTQDVLNILEAVFEFVKDKSLEKKRKPGSEVGVCSGFVRLTNTDQERLEVTFEGLASVGARVPEIYQCICKVQFFDSYIEETLSMSNRVLTLAYVGEAETFDQLRAKMKAYTPNERSVGNFSYYPQQAQKEIKKNYPRLAAVFARFMTGSRIEITDHPGSNRKNYLTELPDHIQKLIHTRFPASHGGCARYVTVLGRRRKIRMIKGRKYVMINKILTLLSAAKQQASKTKKR